jgi:hypothetical protein
MKKFLVPILAAGLLAVMPNDASSDEFQVGGWIGASYDDEYGEFSYCAMDAVFESGHDLVFSLSGDGVFIIALAYPDWQLEYDATYPVTISIDDTDLGQHWAEVIDYDMIGIEIAYTPQTVDLLRSGDVLYIDTAQETLFFELIGTNAAISRLEECVDNSRPNANPFADPGTPGSSANPFSGEDTAPPEPVAVGDEDVQIILDMLEFSGLNQFWYVYPADRYFAFFNDADHTWTDGDITGAMYLFENDPTMTPRDSLGAFFELVRETCLGGFSYELYDDAYLPDGTPTLSGLGQCTDDYGTVLIPALMWDDIDGTNIIPHYADAYFAEGVYDADYKITDFIHMLYTD